MELNFLDDSFDNEVVDFLDELGKTEHSVLSYHYPYYRNMISALDIGQPLNIGLFSKNELVAYLPGFTRTGINGKVYSSLPFFGPNSGVLGKSDSIDDSSQQIMSFLIDYLEEHEFISASLYTSFNPDSRTCSYENYFSNEVSKFSTCLSLNNYEIPAKVKYDIRKSEKLGVELTRDITPEKVEQLYDIYLKNCQDFGIPIKPKQCIESLADQAQLSEKYVSFYFAEHSERLIGGLIILWSQSVASYYLPCFESDFRSFQVNSFLIKHALSDAQNKGIKYWNWESSPSKESGVYKFKKKWGSFDFDYKILIKIFKGENFFKNLGKTKISEDYPYFYVFPFDSFQS